MPIISLAALLFPSNLLQMCSNLYMKETNNREACEVYPSTMLQTTVVTVATDDFQKNWFMM